MYKFEQNNIFFSFPFEVYEKIFVKIFKCERKEKKIIKNIPDNIQN